MIESQNASLDKPRGSSIIDLVEGLKKVTYTLCARKGKAKEWVGPFPPEVK